MNYQIKYMPMISGSYEAEIRKYHRYDTENAIWLWADQPNAGDNIYVKFPGRSEGFGGRTIRFELMDGTVLNLQGPWHTNSTSLYHATNVDLRNKHLTFGVIGMGRGMDLITDVIYIDKEPRVGPFDRVKNLAKTFSKALKCPVAYYSQSTSGSTQETIDASKNY